MRFDNKTEVQETTLVKNWYTWASFDHSNYSISMRFGTGMGNCVYKLLTDGLVKNWYTWAIFDQNCQNCQNLIELSNYAILHFLMNIEIRFPIFTSSLDFNNCINLNMLGFCK